MIQLVEATDSANAQKSVTDHPTVRKNPADIVQFADSGWNLDGAQFADNTNFLSFSKGEAQVWVEAQTVTNQSFVGAPDRAHFVVGSALSDTITGLSYDDFLYAGAGNDIVHIDFTNGNARLQGEIDGSSGIDKLMVSGTFWGDYHLHGVESFEILDLSHASNIQFPFSAVFAFSASAVKDVSGHYESGTAILTVQSDKASTYAYSAILLRDGMWDWQGQVKQNGRWFDVYEHDGAQIRVESGFGVQANARHATAGRDYLEGASEDDVFANISTGDLIFGYGGNDTFHIVGTDFLKLRGGEGYNRLVLDGNNLTLDFTGRRGEKHEIEEIDLTGNGDNTLVLNVEGAKSVAGDFSDLSGRIKINDLHVLGNVGDTLELTDGGWVDKGIVLKTTLSGEHYFRELEKEGQTLFVEATVTIDFLAQTVNNLGDEHYAVTHSDSSVDAGVGDDRIILLSTVFDQIDGGDHYDLLEVAHKNPQRGQLFTLDLDQDAGTDLKSIEEIDLTNNDETHVKLTQQSVLALSDNVDNQGVTTLKVRGHGDSHILFTDEGWQQTGTIVEDNVTFNVHESGNARVLVEHTIEAIFTDLIGDHDRYVQTLTGTEEADHFYNVSAGNIVLAGGEDDLIEINESVFASYLAGTEIDGGEGDDTLALMGADETIEFVEEHARGMANVQNIEAIDLTGSGDNRIIIDAASIMDVVTTGSHRVLKIDGDAGDEVEVKGDYWIKSNQVNLDGEIYDQYVQGDTRLRVHEDVEVISDVGMWY